MRARCWCYSGERWQGVSAHVMEGTAKMCAMVAGTSAEKATGSSRAFLRNRESTAAHQPKSWESRILLS